MNKVISLLAVVLFGAAVVNAAEPPAAAGSSIAGYEYSGWCTESLSQGKKVPTTCTISWTDSKTNKKYCFGNEQMKNEFAKNIEENLKKADAHYKNLVASTTTTSSSTTASTTTSTTGAAPATEKKEHM